MIIALNQKLPIDVSRVIIAKINDFIPNWNKNINFNITVTSEPIEYERKNIYLQTKKYYCGHNNAVINSNLKLKDTNTLLTIYNDQNSNVCFNVLLEKNSKNISN